VSYLSIKKEFRCKEEVEEEWEKRRNENVNRIAGKERWRRRSARKNSKASIEDESVVNIVNTPDAASNNSINQEHVSASSKIFRVSGLTVDSESESIIPSDAPDKLSNAYFIAQQKCISMLISTLLCPDCGLPGVSFQVVPESKCGFAAKAKISCSHCEEICGNKI